MKVMKRSMLATTILASFIVAPANAAFVVTYTQGADGVTAVGTGSLITTGLARNTNFDSFGPINAFIQPAPRTQTVGSLGFQGYSAKVSGTIPPAWGTGGQANATSASGAGAYLNNNGGTVDFIIGTPIGYTSGAAISNSAFYGGQTFASMGLNVGNYIYNYGSGVNADSFSVIVSSEPTVVLPPPTAAVPEPAMWAMMLVGFGGIGVAMRRRKKNVTTTVAFA